MAKDGFTVEDIEEGEISDSASVEEISAEDFKQDIRVSKPKGDSRVWMDDVMKYPISSNYGSGLYNFAWAQAVQNKPLNQSLMREFGSNEKAINSAPNPLVNSRENNNRSLNSSKEVCSVIIDDSSEEIDSRMETVGGDEKEEGELEEGEIDLDSETVDKPEEGSLVERPGEGILSVPSVSETDLKGSDFEKRLNLIRTNLESLTVKDAEKSFPRFCSQLQTSLESLQLMVLESRVPAMDAIIRLSFSRIQDVSSVFHFMNPKQQEQNKDILSRLLATVNRQNPALFSPDQMKEIDAIFRFLDSHNDLLSIKAMDIEKVKHVSNGVNLNEADILSESSAHDMNSSSKKLHLDPISVKSAYQNNITVVPETLKPGMPFGSKNRVNFGPLLDLHRDHDADSLPSPTRETQPPLPLQKPQAVIDGTKSDSATIRVADKMEDTNLHPYETDALKAVSTYQQKFGQSSFLLPSPTPSEEGEDGDGDINGEVSSSSSGSLKTVNAPIPLQTIASATSHTDSLNGQGTIPVKAVGKLGSVSTPILRASAKSRDPRLRYANSDVGALDLNHLPLSVEYNTPKGKPLGEVMSSRKHKAVEDFVLDGHTLKRQRNGLMDSRVSKDVQMVSRSGGWLEDSSSVGPQLTDKNRLVENMGTDPRRLGNGEIGFRKRQDTDGGHFNMSTGGNEQLPATVASTSVSLPSLLKDIAVNPTMLMHLIKMEQQRLAAEAQQKSGDPPNHMMHPSSSNVMLGTVPLVNVASSKPSEPEQNLVVKPQIPTQTASTGEGGKIRMKPRDPRRILHSSNYQKSENLGPEQIKSNEAPLLRTQVDKDNLVVRQQGEQAEANSLSSQSSPSPDIARQFTKNLKNLANILTASQATITPLIIPHTASQATNTPPIVPYTASQAMNTPPIIPYTASQAANTLPIIPHTVSSQTIPLKTEKMDTRDAVTDSSDQRTVTGLTPEEGAVAPPQNVWEDVEHLFEGYDDQQKAAIQRERARRIEEQKKMFAARKLCLVLDLDHTLLNSAKFVEVDPVHDEILRKKEEQDREKPHRHLFRFPHMGMWTKLRPGIWNFLEKASKLYELHLYTMGNKLYATEMAKVLDPSGVLFAGRVISKGDDGDPFDSDERQPKTKDLDGVLGMESAVVIIDDSIRVWPHNKLNLIVVERYTYFPCSRRQFGLLGPSLLEIDHDERPEDGTLASSLVVIEKMHEKFFSHQSLDDVDVRNILASEQRRILAGCRIVFSRVFPVGEANPHLHPLWQTAEQFGAVCTNQIDEQVTHVVANSLGTDKVNWALSTGRHVVHPGWVEASALLYRRVNELDFAVKI